MTDTQQLFKEASALFLKVARENTKRDQAERKREQKEWEDLKAVCAEQDKQQRAEFIKKGICLSCSGTGSYQEGGTFSPSYTCTACNGTGRVPTHEHYQI